MNLLDAFQNFGLALKQETAAEWKAACPVCGGKDRCIIWPNHSGGTGGRFHCRQCGKTGDLIDFLREFMGMSYAEACDKAGKAKDSLAGGERANTRAQGNGKAISFPARPIKAQIPPETWIRQANAFLASCQTDTALNCPAAIEKIAKERFLQPEHCLNFGIGWNASEIYARCQEWGSEGNKLRLPRGIVIATRRKIGPVALTIRTVDADLPRYWQVKGGAKDLPYIAQFRANKPVIILESALDAALLALEAGDLCNAIALGGTCKTVDADTMAFIQAAPLIVLSPDCDDAGTAIIPRWQKLFPTAWTYRAAGAKDLGEMHKLAKIDRRVPTARQWAEHVLKYIKMRQEKRC